MAQDADVYQERLAAMEDQSSDFHAQNAGISRGQPKVNSDFYINRDNGLGCNSLSSLSAGNTTLSKFAGEHFGGLEIKHGEYVGDIEVDVETINPPPVHLIRPDSYSLDPDSEQIGGKNAEDRSSISSLTADLPPRMNQRDRSTLFSKNIHQIHRSSRAQFQVEVEGIRDAFDSTYQTPIDYWRRNNGSQPWYSAKPNQFDLNNKNRLDERTPPSKHEVFVSTPERDLITSEVHINKLIRSPEPSAHHNSSHLSSNNSPARTEQSANFLAYAYGRYSECSRNKRIILLLFLIALLGVCVGVIAASAGTTKDDSLSNKNDKFASFEDVSYQGSQLSLEEALPKDFIDEEAYLRDGADVINSTDTQSNPPSSSSTMNESGPGKSNMPTSSPFLSSSQTHNSLSPTLSSIQKATNSPTSNPSPSPTTLAPLRQPSFIPTPMPSRPPSTPPTSVPTPTPSQSPPSQSPTHKPSRQPSQPPTSNPSRRPSQQPSVKLTRRPTPRPSTDNPTRRPTDMPSPKPSSPPSKEPSKSPSQNPTTLAPSEAPTLKPSESPTHKPSTLAPSITPTLNPSKSPSQKPTTLAPSKAPTLKPSTASPTDEPSWSPSAAPITLSPTSLPSNVPTTLPPYSLPSASPSLKPSLSPSVTPTVKPTTLEPSRRPTSRSPTSNPITYEPSISPSITQTSSPMASLTLGPSTLAVITDPPTPITLTSAPAPTTKVPTSSPVSDTTTDEPSVSTTSIFPTYAPTLA